MQRARFLQEIHRLFRVFPVVALLGPRQVGKTTLSRQFGEGESIPPENLFDLEAPLSLARLDEPWTALEPLRGWVVLDEIQRRPGIFEVLRVLVDRPGTPARFLVLGSASPELIRQSSETLAGRVGFVELTPFQLAEVGASEWRKRWVRGGFPRSFLAEDEASSVLWREGFLRTFVERDLPALGMRIPPAEMRRFWTMLAHGHGNPWNAADLSRSLGLPVRAIEDAAALLEGAFVLRRLRPWHENLNKRQVRAPKVYIRDSGLLHRLLGLDSEADLLHHPKLGASWEGFALESVVEGFGDQAQPYFWGVHTGAELDLMMMWKGKRIGFEFKFGDAPRTTKSMHSAVETLGLDELRVVYPGEAAYPLAERIRVLPLAHACEPPD